jgi:peptidoglycan/LPS O-acetylase OafA/YrhL
MSATAPVTRPDTRERRHGAHRISGLDGLRGIAVAAVLLFHTQSRPLEGGYLGVDMFFVLSGFLITGVLVADGRSGRIALGAFWLRRARRLAPAMLLLLSVLAVVRLALPADVRAAWQADLIAALTYTTNWWEIVQSGDYFAQFLAVSPTLHTWSLAIEEQFYLGFGLFMAVVVTRRVGRGALLGLLALGAGVSIIAMQWATTHGEPSWAYYATVPRLQALLIGAMLAVVLAGPHRNLAEGAEYVGIPTRPGGWGLVREGAGWAGLLGLTVLLAGVWPEDFGPMYTVVAVCVATVIWSILGGGWLAATLSWRPLVLLGLISYGVYLWHWPVFLWLQAEDASLSMELASVLLTVAAATVSYLVVERPIRTGRFTRLPSATQWSAYAMAAVAVLLLILIPDRGPAHVASSVSDEEVAALVTQGQAQPSPQPGQVHRSPRQWPASREVPNRIVINGDSTVLAFGMGFPLDKYPGRVIGGATMLGCGFSTLPYYPGPGIWQPPAECLTWRDEWRSWNSRIDAQVAVTAVSGWDTFDREQDTRRIGPGDLYFDRSFAVAFESGLRIASRGGRIPVYALGMPCYASRKMDGQFRNDPVRRQRLNALAEAVVERIPNAHFVDLTGFTCDEATGISKTRSKALYVDGVHWSPQGGRAVWSLLLQRWQADGLVRAGSGRSG